MAASFIAGTVMGQAGSQRILMDVSKQRDKIPVTFYKDACIASLE